MNISLVHGHGGLRIVNMMKISWNSQQQRVEDSTANDAHEEDSDVVTELVSEESHHWRSNEDTEGKDGVHESNVNIIDADVLHVDGEVGHDGEAGTVEEEQCELERKQVHVEVGSAEAEVS